MFLYIKDKNGELMMGKEEWGLGKNDLLHLSDDMEVELSLLDIKMLYIKKRIEVYDINEEVWIAVKELRSMESARLYRIAVSFIKLAKCVCC